MRYLRNRQRFAYQETAKINLGAYGSDSSVHWAVYSCRNLGDSQYFSKCSANSRTESSTCPNSCVCFLLPVLCCCSKAHEKISSLSPVLLSFLLSNDKWGFGFVCIRSTKPSSGSDVIISLQPWGLFSNSVVVKCLFSVTAPKCGCVQWNLFVLTGKGRFWCCAGLVCTSVNLLTWSCLSNSFYLHL